jgi:hypothetical protein
MLWNHLELSLLDYVVGIFQEFPWEIFKLAMIETPVGSRVSRGHKVCIRFIKPMANNDCISCNAGLRHTDCSD